MSSPRIVPLASATGLGAGGKAEGLARLIALGHRVPPGFVILGASVDTLPDDLAAHYDALGRGKVAVRSSASDEDGDGASFAGQHETILNVEGIDALRDAVRSCLASLVSDHATAYRSSRTAAGEASMTVVVQRMVDARSAGVVFTVHPVSARRDRMVVDAVSGLGDVLVSGHRTPDHHVLERDGRLIHREKAGPVDVLTDAEVVAVGRAARSIADAFGKPIDAEWAIDRQGSLHLLQARPITSLPADPRELDVVADPSHVHTKCNIGEMMPGAATPLTWSTSARGIDYGMQRLYTEIGVQPEILREPVYILQWFGHLFIDLSAMRAIGGGVAGASEKDVVSAICGREVPEVGTAPRVGRLRRFVNGVRYARAVLSHQDRIASLDRILATLRFDEETSVRAQYAALDAQLPLLLEAYYHHLVASMLAGAVASAMLATLARGRSPDESDHARVAELLAGAKDVESHDIALGIERIVEVALRTSAKDALLAAGPDGARRFLEVDGPAELRDAYRAYLARHGHRCVREVEMRTLEWSADPGPILDAIRSGLAASGRAKRKPPPEAAPPESSALRTMVRYGQIGVRAREAAKSKLVEATARFKAAYRALARAMVEAGRIDDPDLVFFVTHEELGALANAGDAGLVALARQRRLALPIQMGLDFKDVFVGAPEPVLPEPPSGDRVLRGKPVSRGVVRGRARVARTLEEARLVEPGEILIAPITDVGWTPVFATIAGLATDIGSAGSHGAVVAREYGLPALVDVRIGTSTFRTGEYVELDADRGVLRPIAAPTDSASVATLG